jgi:peptidoglycan hydrolase CwlO-like protein
MAYQKTAKDKAWDKERQKLKSDKALLETKIFELSIINKKQENEIIALNKTIAELKTVISKLTDNKVSPEEFITYMRNASKAVELFTAIKKGIF